MRSPFATPGCGAPNSGSSGMIVIVDNPVNDCTCLWVYQLTVERGEPLRGDGWVRTAEDPECLVHGEQGARDE